MTNDQPQRKIIHIDMDAFFASVEQRDNPDYQGKPLVVGGKPTARGVVAAASYEARAFGIRSAMSMAVAVKACPTLIIVPPRIAHYREISQEIREIFQRFTDVIEPLSIDEAYLDVTDNNDFNGSATLLAEHIITVIAQQTGLTASAGISYCKFLAKYASNVNKPNATFTIAPHMAQSIIDAMLVGSIHGIGPATQKRLNECGIITGKDLRMADSRQLVERLGNTALFYYQLAHGIDERPLRVSRVRKSLGNETTFANNLTGEELLWEQLQPLLEKTWAQLQAQELMASTLTVKIKYYDFTIRSKSYTEAGGITQWSSATFIARSLLQRGLVHKPVRLLGVSFSQLAQLSSVPRQLRLFG